ncbi:gliding motility-associated C-terminal domain-containing protein [Aquimarina celericrescens]|nr:gliding motility-associated C-terminal domain-containing protein [Aquimarina celericrescens]
MKKNTFFLLFMFFGYLSSFGQIGINENFDNGVPADWTSSFFTSATQACAGESARDNLYSFSNTGNLISPNIVGQSNATDLTISFDYKIVDWSAATNPTAAGWGSFTVDYSTDGGATWINIDTIDDSNHITSSDCATMTYTVAAADLPTGSDFQLRFDIVWAAGDYYMYYDNVSALQVAQDPPNCDAVLSTPADGEIDVAIEDSVLSWSGATGLPNSYSLTVGTTSGGNDILDNENVGNTTSYDLGIVFDYNTTYYVTIIPENDQGVATGDCTEYSFTTEEDPSITVDCSVGPVNTNFCYDSGETTEYVYTSSDGTNLNLVINSGQVENNFDEFIVLDSDGTELYNGYGASGDISGLNFQSSGDQITIQVQADGSISCQSSSNISPIDLTVSCATCINPSASYEVVSNCDSGNGEFFVEVNISDLGSATSLTVSDNQASTPESVIETGVVTFGPFSNNTGVVITVENDDDVNCIISSQNLTQVACPPDNDLCVDAFPAVVNSEQFCTETTSVTITAANGSSVPVSCGGSVAQDVWYEFTANSSAHMVTLIDAPGSVSHAVYEGECNSLTELYCSEEFDNFGNSDGIVATNLTIGNTYYVRVFSSSETSGTFDLCITTPDYEQGNVTCEDVAPFCAPFDNAGNPEPLVFANGYYYLQEFTAEDGPDYGCLGSEPNPAWFYLQVDQTGDLEFEIVQNTAFDGNGNPIGDQLDVDFIVYGPFSELDGNCGDLTSANIVDCSYSASAVEDMILPGADAGDIYLVLITNFNQSPGYISLVQTNYGESGGGTTDCTILDETVYGCEGEDLVLTSQFLTQSAYTWYVYNEDTDQFEFLSQGDEDAGYNLTVNEEGIFRLISFDSAGIPVEEEFTVVFSPSPVVDLGPDDSLCDVTDLTLDATPANASEFGPDVEYIWYLDGVEIAGETNATIIITDEGTYSVEVIGTVLDDSGNPVDDSTCAGTDEVEISNADFTVSLGDDQVLCDGDSYVLEAEVTGEDTTNATYTWFDSNNNVIPGATNSTFEVTTEGTYYVEVSIEGCESVDGVEILFPDSPEVDLGADAIVCSGATYSLDATPSNASDFDSLTYSWLDADGVEVSIDAMPSLPGGTYMVTVMGEFTNNGMPYTCEGTDQIVIDDVTYNIDLGGDQELCGMDPYTITATITDEDTTNATYQWSDSSGPIPGETGSSYTATTDGTYTVEVTIDGCADTASVDLLFDLSPQIDLGSDVTTCDLTPYTIDATPVNMPASDVVYTWSLDGTELTSETGATLDPSSYGFGTYTVTAVSVNDPDGSCEVSASVVYTEAAIDLTITATQGETAITIPYCSDSEPVPSHTITFTASADGAPAGVNYQWYLDGTAIAGATDPSYTVTYDEEGVFVEDYSVEVSYDSCLFTSGSTPVEVTIEPYENGCVISQGISPSNVDGFNDCLDLTFLDDRTGIESLKVYNRYGRLVFERDNYVNSFCGQDINGDELPSGTYYYVLVLEGEDPVFGRIKKSWVYINREAN